MSTIVSQKEYIKRYLSKSDNKTKKKKRKRDVTSQPKLRIIDDDIDMSTMRPIGSDELELYNLDEDAPQVAGIIDERPEELRTLEEFRTSKRWKVVSDSMNDIKVTEFDTSKGEITAEHNVELENNERKLFTSSRVDSMGAESDESPLPRSRTDSKQKRENSDAFRSKKSKAPNVSNLQSQEATGLCIKSERLSDSDSDISVSRKSNSRLGSECDILEKQKVKESSSHTSKRSYRDDKKVHSNNKSENSHHVFDGGNVRKQHWKNDVNRPSSMRTSEGHKRNIRNTGNESQCSDSDMPQPKKYRNKYNSDRATDRKDLYKHSHSKHKSSEDSDLSLPRPSSQDKVKHSREKKKENQKRGSDDESDSDLSLPRPLKSTDRVKPKMITEMRKRNKDVSSEESDSDLSLTRPTKSSDRAKPKMPKEMRKRNKDVSSEESDSDLSLPRPTKSSDRAKPKMTKETRKRNKDESNEESDSDLSLPRSSKIKSRSGYPSYSQMKTRNIKDSSDENDSDSSQSLPSRSKLKQETSKRKNRNAKELTRSEDKHHMSEEARKKGRRKESSERSDSDFSPSRSSRTKDSRKYRKSELKKKSNSRNESSEGNSSDLSPPRKLSSGGNSYLSVQESKLKDRDRERERNASGRVDSSYSKTKMTDADPSRLQTSRENAKFDHSPGRETRDSQINSAGERGTIKHSSSHHKSSLRREKKQRSDSPQRQPSHLDSKHSKTGTAESSRSREAGNKKLQRTLDGKLAGLQDAKNLREEIKSFRERENDMFSKMSDAVSGRLAEAVQRDRKTGKKRDLEEEARQKREKEEKDKVFKEKYSRWGKGLKQVEDQKQNLEEAVKLMAKPLARYADDEDLDNHLREMEREGDPMLEYIRSKKSSSNSQTNARPKYQGSYPTNRFGIPPGYRWDGVDRSNGYEKQWFEQRSAQKAREEEAYKWSTADM